MRNLKISRRKRGNNNYRRNLWLSGRKILISEEPINKLQGNVLILRWNIVFCSAKLTEKFHTNLAEKLFLPQFPSNFPHFPTTPEYPLSNLSPKNLNSPASSPKLYQNFSMASVTTPISNIYYFHG